MAALFAGCFLLAELGSGNIPFPQIVHPFVLVFLAVAYGLPVLLIREAMVRWRLGIAGAAVLGLAYGLYNEGVVAKTIFLTAGPPLFPSFWGYGMLGGVNVPWLCTIAPWHSMNAVLYPILIVSALWPGQAREPWLGEPQMAAFALLSSALGIFAFFKAPPGDAPALAFAGLVGAIAALALLARSLGPAADVSAPARGRLSDLARGFLGAPLLYFGPIQWIAARRVPLGVFLALAMGALALLALLLRAPERRSPDALALFAIGNGLAGSVIRMATQTKSPYPWEPAVVGSLFLLGLLAVAWRIYSPQNALIDTRPFT
jgi:hypothetical protein